MTSNHPKSSIYFGGLVKICITQQIPQHFLHHGFERLIKLLIISK